VLVSSREPLQVYGERVLPVASLALPDVSRLPPFEELQHYAAIRLFVERAQASKPDFALTQDNAATVAHICASLDGLPLAIEMAAARVKWHSAHALLSQLRLRLPLLASSLRGLDPRQQTLRSAIDWSYNLLDRRWRRLFAMLALFVGGCTIEAAEAVCGELGLLADLQSLVDKSLLHYQAGADDQPRFTMLETIREYAREVLDASGESASVQQRHAEYYAALVQTAVPALLGGEQQGVWLNRLEIEYNNIRAALAWSLDHGPDAEFALRFTDALFMFWNHRSYFSEGRRWLEAAAALAVEPTLLRARVLNRAGGFAWGQGDDRHARALQEQALAIQETIGDRKEISRSLQHLGILAGRQSDYERASILFERSLAIERELDNKSAIATIANNLAIVAQRQGAYARAEALLSECIGLNGELGDRRGMAYALHTLGMLTRRLDKYRQAVGLFQQSIGLRHALGDKRGIANSLEYLAEIAITLGHGAHAARLLGAAEALREEISAPIGADERDFFGDALARLHVLLEASTCAKLWKAGRSLTFAQILTTAQIQF
jgi:predicted ATPase